MTALICLFSILLSSALGSQHNKRGSEVLAKRLAETITDVTLGIHFVAASGQTVVAFDTFITDYISHRGNHDGWKEPPTLKYTPAIRFMATFKLTAKGDESSELGKMGTITKIHLSANGVPNGSMKPLEGFVYGASNVTFNEKSHTNQVILIIREFIKIWGEKNLQLALASEPGKKWQVMVGNAFFDGKYNQTEMGDYMIVPIDIV